MAKIYKNGIASGGGTVTKDGDDIYAEVDGKKYWIGADF